MHWISVTFISEYNQSYHTYRLVINVYILLCVIGAQLKWISTTQNLSQVKYFSKYFIKIANWRKSKDKTNNSKSQQSRRNPVQKRQFNFWKQAKFYHIRTSSILFKRGNQSKTNFKNIPTHHTSSILFKRGNSNQNKSSNLTIKSQNFC